MHFKSKFVQSSAHVDLGQEFLILPKFYQRNVEEMLEARDVLAEKRHQIFLIDHENNRMALSMFVVSLVVKVRVEAKKDIELAEK